MTLWQTEIMEENARAQMWEDLNEERPDPDSDRKWDASGSLDICLEKLSKVREWLEDAAECVHGLPDEDCILSMLPDIDEVCAGIRNIQKDLKGV